MADTVLITGASQGIGKATALLFARQGYDVILAARQPDRLEAVALEIRSLGRSALAIPTDVREAKQVQNLIELAIARFDRIDVLINNASIFTLGTVEEFSLDDWRQAIDTNIWGYIYTINALLPHFLERRSGTIVNVGSIGGLVAIPYQVPYATSKYAVTGLTKSLQAELAPKGIQVCGIYPSFIRSSIIERTIFTGKDEQTVRDRYELVSKTMHNPLVEKSEDVAQAIWDAVDNQKSDVLVGTAKVLTATYNIFPGLIKSVMRRVFGMKERTIS